ncbi:hypothetical protein ACFQH3_11820 [Haladaptatus sp. GCM10025707]|uniref:DUF7519 family protein n=1 Tax=unclassified Haladaptatus TaxID=2622732 RepID=UPI0023E76BEC|nr:hypothetical protein [Haladaptatus sp. QDMS2]
MSDIDRTPPDFGRVLTMGVALVAVLVAAYAGPATLLLALAGLVSMGIGVLRGRRLGVTVGAGVLFVALLLAGVSGFSTPLTLLGAGAAILAWDVGENAVSLGEQLGRETATKRAQLVHAGGSLVVALLVGTLAVGVFELATGTNSLTALVLLLIGALMLTSVLRE